MNKTEFFKRVEKEISETKERLKRAKEKENYYESVKDFGEDYTKAKFNRIKEEQALLYLEPFVNLPEILYTVSASSDVIGVHKREEIDKILSNNSGCLGIVFLLVIGTVLLVLI